jgi:lysyl-tRNA synthetase class 2
MTSDNATPANAPAESVPQDENKLIAERREKLKALRGQGVAFPNDFKVDAFAGDLQAEFADLERWTAEAIEGVARRVKVAGRVILKRDQGKVAFVQMQDFSGRIQLFIHQGTVGEDTFKAFKGWDMGDIVGAEGVLMRTKTGELSVKANSLRLLTKSLRCPISTTAWPTWSSVIASAMST